MLKGTEIGYFNENEWKNNHLCLGQNNQSSIMQYTIYMQKLQRKIKSNEKENVYNIIVLIY